MAFVNALPLRAPPHAARRVRVRAQCARRAMTAMAESAGGERMLHAVYRAGDMARTGDFLRALGMTLLRDRDVPEGKYANAFYGFGTESRGEHFALELTYNYGVSAYKVGNALGAFVVAAPRLDDVERQLRDAGFQPTASADGLHVLDPTGYPFRVTSSAPRRDPLVEMQLNVSDVAASVAFYEAVGMRRAMDGDEAILSYGPPDDSTTLRLRQHASALDLGDGYGQIAVSTPSVYDLADRMRAGGVNITREPGPVPGIGTKITAVRDPDGYKVVFVDEADFEDELA